MPRKSPMFLKEHKRPRIQWVAAAVMSDNPPAMHLLERQQQLETLTENFSEARAGSGKFILIAGEAGLGKSSLVEQFIADTRRHARILWGACDALDTPRALGPVH